MEKQISSDLIRGHIDTIILHTLLDGDKYPQQISETVELKSENKYQLNQATLYSSLKRLEGLSLVESYWNDIGLDGRRKFYKITEKGKKTVDENLSSWTYSRAIIDKLMNLEDSTVKTVIIQKEVLSENPPLASVVKDFSNEKNGVVEEKITENPPKNEENSVVFDKSTEKEINFRNIIYGLIKTESENSAVEEKQKIVTTDDAVSDENKPKFNDTIEITDYNSQKSNNNGKIDYGDLTLKASKEGYKIRISSKDSAKPSGNLYINKLHLFSSIVLMLLCAVEYIVLTANFGSNYAFITKLIAFLLILVCPVVFLIKFIMSPKLAVSKKIHPDSILTAFIVIFNLILITLALNFVFKNDFKNTKTVVSFLVVPLIVYFDFGLFFVVQFFLSKLKLFYLKK